MSNIRFTAVVPSGYHQRLTIPPGAVRWPSPAATSIDCEYLHRFNTSSPRFFFMQTYRILGLVLLALPSLAAPAIAQAQEVADKAGIEFFEQKIRPVLVQHCYSCHSAEAQTAGKLKGSLFVDSPQGLLTGGDTGPALVKGKSADSLLIEALKYGDLKMPPAGKLPDSVIADFSKWVDLGAPDPRTAATTSAKRVINLDEGRTFWSFLPLRAVTPPAESAAMANPIDRFVQAKQVEKGVVPNGPASKEKLIRRAYYDLVGLPPTPEQVLAFLQDNSPTAFEKVVDELLQSAQYGERWSRHWLDAARFAESGGYEFDGFRAGAYHYRDWVIRSLNQDLPYDQFVRMQLAGDKLQPGFDGSSATGFLVAGPYPGQITAKTVERIRYDQLDDMIMTIGGSMLGLTLGCVRCHDHKYDPLPQQDYYGIASALGQTAHGPITVDPNPAATQQALEQHAAAHTQLLNTWKTFAMNELPARFTKWQQTDLPKLQSEPRWHVLDALSVSAQDTWLSTADEGLVIFTGPRRKDGDVYTVTAQTNQLKITAIRLDALTDKSLPARGPGFGGDGSFTLGDFKVVAKPLNPASTEPPVTLQLTPVLAAFEEAAQPLKNAVDDNPGTFWRANANGGKDNAALFEIVGGLPGFKDGTLLTFELRFVSQGLGRFRFAVSTDVGTPTWAGEVVPQHLAEIKAILAANNNTLPEALREPMVRWFSRFDPATDLVRRPVDEHARTIPRPPLTEVYTTVAGGQEVFLLKRGEVENKAGKAEPSFLQVLETSVDHKAWLTKPEGPVDARIALAAWMTDVERGAGPLLARVLVNRVWQHHFGKGLVGTPNDFGAQGERPTHPELLEWLAKEFVSSGWKLKPLHKRIMLSAVYQQGSEVDPANVAKDPENQFLWHSRPKRLEAESVRDALLAVGGNIDSTMYGPSVLDNTNRRSIYLRVKRSELIPFLTTFDAPEPTQSIGERISTTVPTQSLVMMNSPFVHQQAEKLAQRIRPAAGASLSTSIDQAYQIALSRAPTELERQRMLAFMEQQITPAGGTALTPDQALTEFCQVLLCLSEFVYVD